VQQAICDLAASVERLVQAGDANGLVAISQPKPYRCEQANTGQPSNLPPGLPTPAPEYGYLSELCAGAAPNEQRPGFSAGTAGEGFPVNQARYREFVTSYLSNAARALRDRSDIYGAGITKVGTIFCNRAPPGGPGLCDLAKELAINLTYISSGPGAPTGTGDVAGQRTTFTVWVQRTDNGQLAPFGIGQPIPPNHVLTENVFRTTLPDGSVVSQAWYAWTP
jgi:hypothetical protein